MNLPLFARLVAAFAALFISTAAVAETHQLDDSLSHTVPPTAQMQWRPQTRSDVDGGMEAWVVL